MSTGLRIAEDFCLPLQAATETFALLAKRGAGKTNTAVVIVEELLKAGVQCLILDPVGVWWGLRSSADGKHHGLPVLIMGGEHGDLPLAPGDGTVIGEFGATEGISAVLDISEMTKGEQIRFVTGFAEKLWHRKAREEFRTPVMLVLEEADEFAPQSPMPDERPMLSVIQRIIKLGRNRGIGAILITQRPASLAKNCLTQTSVLGLLQLIAPQDRKAARDWLDAHGVEEDIRQVMEELPSLPVGTCWFLSTGWLHALTRVHIRRRETYDSSATPTVGQSRRPPPALADLNLDALRSKLGRVIEQARENDPKVLRDRIAELERMLRQRAPVAEVRETRVEIPVEVPMLRDGEAALLHAAAAEFAEQGERVLALGESILAELRGREGPAQGSGVEDGPPGGDIESAVTVQTEVDPVSLPSPASQGHNNGPPLDRGAIHLLQVLARHHPTAVTRAQLGTLAKRAPKGGSFNLAMGQLRRAGYIRVSRAEGREEISATDDGLRRVGAAVRTARTPEEQRAIWKEVLETGTGRLFRILEARYPDWLTRQELADEADYASAGGAFNGALGTLSRNRLVQKDGGGRMRLHPALFGDHA